MHRPNEQEFLSAVLEELDELPPGFAERLIALVDKQPGERAQAIQELIAELTRD